MKLLVLKKSVAMITLCIASILTVEGQSGIYFLDGSAKALLKIDLDGSNPTTLASGLQGLPFGLVHDPENSLLYFTEVSAGMDPGRIKRIGLDGAGLNTVYQFSGGSSEYNAISPAGILVNPLTHALYFTDIANDRLWEGNTAGGLPADLLGHKTFDPLALTSPDGASLTWTAAHTSLGQPEGILNTAVLDNLILGISDPAGISTDLANSRYFYTRFAGGANNSINRVDFDGNNDTVILDNLNFVANGGAIFVESTEEKIYWTEQGGAGLNKVRRANYDGSDIEDLYVGDNYLYGLVVVIPEPTTYAAFFGAVALCGLLLVRRRKA